MFDIQFPFHRFYEVLVVVRFPIIDSRLLSNVLGHDTIIATVEVVELLAANWEAPRQPFVARQRL
jgi:hypothetical protein